MFLCPFSSFSPLQTLSLVLSLSLSLSIYLKHAFNRTQTLTLHLWSSPQQTHTLSLSQQLELHCIFYILPTHSLSLSLFQHTHPIPCTPCVHSPAQPRSHSLAHPHTFYNSTFILKGINFQNDFFVLKNLSFNQLAFQSIYSLIVGIPNNSFHC